MSLFESNESRWMELKCDNGSTSNYLCVAMMLLFAVVVIPLFAASISFVSSPFVDKFKIIHYSRKNPKFDVLSFLLFYLLFRPFHLQSNKAIN